MTSVDKSRRPAYILVHRIRIKNFKSIQDLALDLQPGVNVLVGRNASGKTNILEAIAFMRRALVDAAERIPYRPHVPGYWSPLDIMYERDSSRTLLLGLDMAYYLPLKGSSEWARTDVSFSLEMAYNPAADTLEPSRYIIRVGEHYYTSLEIRRESIVVETSAEQLKRLRDELEQYMDEKFKRFPQKIGKVFKEEIKEIIDKYRIEGNKARLVIRPQEPIPMSMLPRVLLASIPGPFLEGEDVFLGIEELSSLPGSPSYAFIVGFRRVSKPEGLPIEHVLAIPAPAWIAPLLILRVLSRIILLRHPDIGAISEPVKFTGSERLDERARNLAEVLLVIQGRRGRVPERVERALRELFPGISIRVETRFGRVVLVGEENGVELPPPCLPDGLVKLVALMLAADLGPAILLVDEIENSMHARLLEYVIDELNSLGVPVLVATHSPIVVDLVKPERVLIVRKSSESGTVVERIKAVEELKQRLVEEGVALSDYVFYGETYVEKADAS